MSAHGASNDLIEGNPVMADERAGKARFSHFGICVADTKRSTDFYKNAFGFVDESTLEIENTINKLTGIDDELFVVCRFLSLGNHLIELLNFQKPGTFGSTQARPMNQVGLTHMALNVSDLDAVCRDVEAWGGTVLYDTKVPFDYGDNKGHILYVTDPDGTRIELMGFPKDINVRVQ
jgi:predicted enzyme related to lactoylglutathione lyase